MKIAITQTRLNIVFSKLPPELNELIMMYHVDNMFITSLLCYISDRKWGQWILYWWQGISSNGYRALAVPGVTQGYKLSLWCDWPQNISWNKDVLDSWISPDIFCISNRASDITYTEEWHKDIGSISDVIDLRLSAALLRIIAWIYDINNLLWLLMLIGGQGGSYRMLYWVGLWDISINYKVINHYSPSIYDLVNTFQEKVVGYLQLFIRNLSLEELYWMQVMYARPSAVPRRLMVSVFMILWFKNSFLTTGPVTGGISSHRASNVEF